MDNKDIKENSVISAEDISRELPTAIIRWYPFMKEKDILYIGDEDAIFEMLSSMSNSVVREDRINDEECFENGGRLFDYVVDIGSVEKTEDVPGYLAKIKSCLSKDGVLLLGVNNRLGIRNFCGDRDAHTQRNFDGIEDYRRAYSKAEDDFAGRSYDKSQLKKLLEDAGFLKQKWYGAYPGLEDPFLIYAEGYLPNEDLSCRIIPEYRYPASVFLEEAPLYPTLMANGLFHLLANAFLIECAFTEEAVFSDALHITSTLRRGRKNATITVIHDNDIVTKEAAYPEGRERIKEFLTNEKRLNERGIRTVGGRIEDGRYIMPLLKGETGQVYLKRLFHEDRDQFLMEMDKFRDIIVRSSDISDGVYMPPLTDEEREKSRKKKLEIIEDNKKPTKLLKHAYLDMVPLNSFHIDGDFVFYDQEFCEDDYPLNVVIDRMIVSFYTGDSSLYRLLPMEELLKRYGIYDDFSRWDTLEHRFIWNLRNDEVLAERDRSVRADSNVVIANRQRMNYSTEDYQRLFVDIFEYADSRKLILFGSGLFAKRFLTLYGNDYKVFAVVDNNQKQWGEKLYPKGYDPERDRKNYADNTVHSGIEINSPEILRDMRHGEFKVMICIRNYLSVMNQLDEMGISEYSIFDPGKAYPRRRHPICLDSAYAFENSTVSENKKKYHVGYIAGVFDLYHVGHLNMFRRAKEQCDYLIVGVVSDEGVRRFKQVDPFVPFDERIDMVRSCRYVDEAVEIPYMFNGTQDAWRLHHFDVQFSGSDYVDDPNFARYKEFLEKHGATMEFFPYTQSTSSTKLKELIEKKLL